MTNEVKTTRNLKVIGQSGYRYQATPTVMQKGKWLSEFGFDIGTHVKVECKHIVFDEIDEQPVRLDVAFVESCIVTFEDMILILLVENVTLTQNMKGAVVVGRNNPDLAAQAKWARFEYAVDEPAFKPCFSSVIRI